MNVELARRVMKKGVEEQGTAGISLLVQKQGEEPVFLAEGMADREAGIPIRRDTIFRLFSQSKPVCAAAAMILLERGELELYQPVSELLPGFRGQKVYENGEYRPVQRDNTVYDLLQMTSGISYPDESTEAGRQSAKVFHEAEDRLYSDHQMTTLELAHKLGQCPLVFEPGSRWMYGASADVLGAVIEVVSGMRFGDFLKKEIFDPLGMKDTAFWVPEEKKHRLPKAYEQFNDNGRRRVEPLLRNHLGIDIQHEQETAFESGGAGICSTLDDFMRFAQMLLNGGELDGIRILQENTVKFLTDGALQPWQQDSFENSPIGAYGYTYGRLMSVCRNESQNVMLSKKGEYGWGGWLGTQFSNLPEQKTTILMGMQTADDGLVRRKLRNTILASL